MHTPNFERALHEFTTDMMFSNSISSVKPYVLIALPGMANLSNHERRNHQLVQIKKAQLAVERLGLQPTSVVYGNNDLPKADNMLNCLGNHIIALRQSQFVYFGEGWENDFTCVLLHRLAGASGRTVLYEKEPTYNCGSIGVVGNCAGEPF